MYRDALEPLLHNIRLQQATLRRRFGRLVGLPLALVAAAEREAVEEGALHLSATAATLADATRLAEELAAYERTLERVAAVAATLLAFDEEPPALSRQEGTARAHELRRLIETAIEPYDGYVEPHGDAVVASFEYQGVRLALRATHALPSSADLELWSAIPEALPRVELRREVVSGPPAVVQAVVTDDVTAPLLQLARVEASAVALVMDGGVAELRWTTGRRQNVLPLAALEAHRALREIFRAAHARVAGRS